MSDQVRPASLEVKSILLIEAAASRNFEREFEGQAHVDVEYAIDKVEYNKSEFFFSTRYTIELYGEDETAVAHLKSSFLVVATCADFSSPPISGEDLLSLELAASLAAHPYHREMLIELSERFDIPTYRMSFQFEVGEFVERGLENLQEV